MAERRKVGSQRGRKFVSGVGKGLSDVMSYLLAENSREQQQVRMLNRQSLLSEQNTLQQLTAQAQEKVANGEWTPEQAEAMLASRGVTADPGAITSMQPPLARRKVFSEVGDRIGSATTPETVPMELEIMNAANAAGAPNIRGLIQMASAAGMDPAAFMGETPTEVQSMAQTAGAKRRALRERPTQFVEQQTPEGGSVQTPVSLYGGPVSTKLTAADRGRLSGVEKMAELVAGPTPEMMGTRKGLEEAAQLNVAGPSRARQAGAEAQAGAQGRFNVEFSPQAQGARINEAAAVATAQARARMPFEMQAMREKAMIDVRTAVDKTHAEQVASAAKAASDLVPFLEEATKLTEGMNTGEGVTQRVLGGFRSAMAMGGMDADVTRLDQLIQQNARRWAVAMGVREANVSESETAGALRGIGLRPGATATERQNALNSLWDLATLGPAVAARVSPQAGIQERMDMAKELAAARNAARAQAVKTVGATQFIDPVTNTLMPVIRR
jgi:uncharacterized protein YdeI (YjbR/CyaY-like superfamily)